MRADLRTLSIGERIRLVTAGRGYMGQHRRRQALLLLSDEQRIELDRRLDAYESGDMRGREASEVVAALKIRL